MLYCAINNLAIMDDVYKPGQFSIVNLKLNSYTISHITKILVAQY